MVYDPLSLAMDSGHVFLFIALYKKPYLDLGKILLGGWDNVFHRNYLIRIFLLNSNNMYDDSFIYILIA